MTDLWKAHDAPYGGTWLVSYAKGRCEVIAPPGIRISLGENADPLASGSLRGWRRLVLADDDVAGDPLALATAETAPLSTPEVVDLLGPAWTDRLRQIMLAQLNFAESFNSAQGRLPRADDCAPAVSPATAWLLRELHLAFPDEDWG
jgi:hypothetical protein